MTSVPELTISDVYFYAEHKCGMVKQQMQAIITDRSIKIKCMKCQGVLFYRRVTNI